MFLSACSVNTRSSNVHVGCMLLLLLSPALVAAQSALVLHLPCEDPTNPIDASDNPATVVVHGSLKSADGQFGTMGLEFDGDNANRLEVTSVPKLEGMSALTVEAWVLGRNVATYEGMSVVSKRIAWGDSDLYNMFIWTDRLVNARVNAEGGNALISTTAIEDDTWYHIAFVFDGQGAAGDKVRLYINGVLEDSGDHPSSAVNVSGAPVWIGELDANRGFAWDGIMDEIGIWSVALSADQINWLMGNADKAEILNFASGPTPADSAVVEATWVNLAWSPGQLAISHDVYLGENLDEVNDATVDSPAFRGNHAGTFLVVGFPGFAFPDGLVPGTTYYWRVDAVNDAEPDSPWKGAVWSFSIPPKTAYNPDPVDGAGFVDPNATFTWTPGFGAKLHTVYIGEDYDDVDNASGGMPLGTPSYEPGTLEREKVLYWRVDEFDALETHKGDIWSFTTPGAVGNPQPANGAVDVQIIETLSWTPADSAASSELYFGTDADAVKNATPASLEYVGNKALGAESHDPGELTLDTTYHWRVDAVYPDKTVKGLLWSFTVADFILVDDFESYNDIDPPDEASNRIFDAWIDGFGTTTNGALVGNDLPPYAEQTIVHGGAQSLIYSYDNGGKTSEATLTLVYPRDWTEQGAARLSLWFRGNSDNAADRIFIALNGTAAVYHDNTSATQLTGWNEWMIELSAFGGLGVDLANVNSITIGIGTKGSPAAGGTGTMYFDDIRLYR
ncbi:MAG: LamG domain-containing protein [Planctomycetota bacterium]